ncbi:MAG: hypothetical protein JWP01_610 [Myxococcales bacterium]|nr:hypothetical protein [Myxococcales bacterium]
MGRVRRWTAICAFVGCVLGLSYVLVAPSVVAAKVRGELAAHGYPDAQLHVDSIGLRHIELSGVTLREGLSLGAVSLDAGLSMLWGDRIDEITIRGANVSSAALQASSGTPIGSPTTRPFRRLRIADSTLVIRDTEVAVAGTIAFGPPHTIVDLDTRIASVRRGALVAHDVVGHVTARDEVIRACVTGTVVGAGGDNRAHACAYGQVQGSSIDDARYDGHLEVVVPIASFSGATVRLATISAEVAGALSDLELRGTARARAVELHDRFQTQLAAPQLAFAVRASIDTRGVTVVAREPHILHVRDTSFVAAGSQLAAHQATVSLPAGSIRMPGAPLVWPRALTWTAPKLEWAGIRLTGASGTFEPLTEVVHWRATRVNREELAFHAASGTVTGTQLAWRADRASWRDAGVVGVRGSVDLERGIGRWTARNGRWGRSRFTAPGGVVDLDPSRADRVEWRTMSGPYGVELGAGSLRYRGTRGGIRIEHGTVAAAGGQLDVQPVTVPDEAPTDVLLRARGLSLGELAAKVGRGRMRATGVVDGEITLHVGGAGCSLKRGLLRTRGHGTVQIGDGGLRSRLAASASTPGLAVHHRVAAALADFQYSQVIAVLGAPGAGPDLRVVTRGRGNRVPQDLDLVITIRGVRDAADRFSRRVSRGV